MAMSVARDEELAHSKIFHSLLAVHQLIDRTIDKEALVVLDGKKRALTLRELSILYYVKEHGKPVPKSIRSKREERIILGETVKKALLRWFGVKAASTRSNAFKRLVKLDFLRIQLTLPTTLKDHLGINEGRSDALVLTVEGVEFLLGFEKRLAARFAEWFDGAPPPVKKKANTFRPSADEVANWVLSRFKPEASETTPKRPAQRAGSIAFPVRTVAR